MARKSKTAAKPTTAPESDQYGMTLSRQRLEREGFQPQAWSHTGTRETIDSWAAMVMRQTRDESTVRMTRAFLFLRERPHLKQDEASKFETLITSQSVGPLIISHVFATGHKSALHLALASKKIWAILAASVNYFDFYAGRLQNLGPTCVFISTTPEFTRQEMMATRLTDPYGLRSATPCTDWHNAAITREEDIISTLYMVRKRLGLGADAGFLERIFEPPILAAIRAVEDLQNIFKANQFTSLSSRHVFEPQMIYAATRLQLLLIKLFHHRKNTQVLHFHQTPFLDRRILAIVLRSSPHVTMLGVYNCPLIHFADLVPLLDLIHEINDERKRKDEPLISAFDFYPSFHRGLTGPEGRRPTYGLTADSADLDIVQRGIYAILLKSFLKSQQMQLGLLFEPGQALKAFLFRLPNPPLSIPTFFDGLCRYLEKGASVIQKRQALFDLTKPIRLGLEPSLDDERWYWQEMGSYLPFCSSCGYEMLNELFPAGTRHANPHRRICAACALQDLLDREPHDMRDWKVGLLAKLMPEWDGLIFNKDAPTGSHTGPESDLMRLQETATLRTEPSPLFINEEGNLTARRHAIQRLRDNKYPADSLQNLPSLRDLTTDAAYDQCWANLFNHCNRADIYARARQRVHAEWRKNWGPSEFPHDCYGEVWRRRKHEREVQSFNYTTAVQLHVIVREKGW
ncbi:hypothetical protein V2A60_007634 [Cordyceps javanica]|uniref:Ribosomal protein L36 n=1 Tax=Cordyceps javanica TaxID=43265 RepID=A0A545VAA9_9HYPO|nr:Ribosomal protein L36 [Cordyceps javanica]TQW09865.1 Ribosomal protein L36 [Cordyceps javanica]